MNFLKFFLKDEKTKKKLEKVRKTVNKLYLLVSNNLCNGAFVLCLAIIRTVQGKLHRDETGVKYCLAIEI